jgi:hypothetical protein
VLFPAGGRRQLSLNLLTAAVVTKHAPANRAAVPGADYAEAAVIGVPDDKWDDRLPTRGQTMAHAVAAQVMPILREKAAPV